MLNSNSETLTVLSIDPPLVSEKYEESRVRRGRVQAGRHEAQAEQLRFAPWCPCTTAFLADAPTVVPESLTVLAGHHLHKRRHIS